jgi:hypothetical protein
VLDLYISRATNGINFTQLERQRLKRITDEGSDETNSEEVTMHLHPRQAVLEEVVDCLRLRR